MLETEKPYPWSAVIDPQLNDYRNETTMKTPTRPLAAAFLFIVLSTLVGTRGVANATEFNNCTVEGGYFCAFNGINYDYSGGKGRWISDSSNWAVGIDYQDSSAVNLSYGYRVKVYTTTWGGPVAYCVPLNTSRPNLSTYYGVYDVGNTHTFNTGTC